MQLPCLISRSGTVRVFEPELHRSVTNPTAEPEDRQVNMKGRADLVKERHASSCRLWARELRVLLKSPRQRQECPSLRSSQGRSPRGGEKGGKGAIPRLPSRLPSTGGKRSSRDRVSETGRVHCLQHPGGGKLNPVVVNNYRTEIALFVLPQECLVL